MSRLKAGEPKDDLLKIFPSTVDRLLKPYRDKAKLKGRYRGNPSSIVKKFIKVETWFERPKEPGYVEIDLVHHSGASGKGEFTYTLTATEVSTGWTEVRALKNKAMIWTRRALDDVYCVMPVPIKKLHSDNGSEFINAHVKSFCKERGMVLLAQGRTGRTTRLTWKARNWSMVRAYTDWMRCDTDNVLEGLIHCSGSW